MSTSYKLFNYSARHFSVLPKAPKMELTMRSPYKTFFKNFIGFQRLYINSLKGQRVISNRTYPTMYLLPAGEIKLVGMIKSEGSFVDQTSTGEFVHSGGWCFVHDNNTVDINLMECVEKEKFAYDKVDTALAQGLESDSRWDKEACNFAAKKVLKKK